MSEARQTLSARRVSHLPLPFILSNRMEWMRPLGRASLLYLVTNSNAKLFQNHLLKHTQKMCYQLGGHPSAQAS